MLNKTKKNRIISKFRTHEGDTGSAQVQIAILSEEIKELQEHLGSHKKDFSSRRGLIRKVNARHRLLNYLMREDEKSYEELIVKLKLKRRQTKLAEERRLLAEQEAAAAAKLKLQS